MEQSNKPLVFDVIAGDDKVILETVAGYNEMYKTDFEVVEFIYEEVVFARLKVTNYKMSDIFALGYYFHSTVILKRESGKIDW